MPDNELAEVLAESSFLSAEIVALERTLRRRREERLAVWARARTLGATDKQIGRSAGISQPAVTNSRRRAGRPPDGKRNRSKADA